VLDIIKPWQVSSGIRQRSKSYDLYNEFRVEF
jgi:hypothetical protein